MSQLKKVLAFGVSSLIVVFVGLAVLNRLRRRVPVIDKALG